MNQLAFAFAFFAGLYPAPQPFKVQYVQGVCGQNVQVRIDGKQIHATFAGKLGFTDGVSSWSSVCAAVRSPIVDGQYFGVRKYKTSPWGGTLARAGNIAAKYFDAAETPEQCAGLQLAVWEALEDGGDQPNFANGRFQARASQAALNYAAYYYQAIGQDGNALFLQAGSGGGQSQITSTTN